MLSEANFLILDEPTNHLDITSKEILENALVHYEGTVLFVSHDRYFINKTATRILDLHGHQVLNYIGNYDYYLEKKDVVRLAYQKEEKAGLEQEAEVSASASRQQWKQQKAEQSARRKLENELKKAEERIEKLELEKEKLEEKMAQPEVAVVSAKVMELHTDLQRVEDELEKLYGRWEELSLELD